MSVQQVLSVAVPLVFLVAMASDAVEADGDAVQWYDAKDLGVEGRGWTDTESFYDRLPARAHGVVRDPVWSLSKDSAGMCVRFATDARAIWARWTLRSKSLAMSHMAATGVSGVDLYVRRIDDDGKPVGDGVWHWAAVGRPEKFPTNEKRLVGGMPAGRRECLLYLPLYNGVTSVEIGAPEGATLTPAPPRPADRAKPICFYGTSITQGGCASRPGMVYTAIVGRWLDRPVINLGFSGNGKMDPEVVDLLAELDVSAYVIDCLPNMNPDLVAERTRPLVEKLRKARPDTPIVLVENITYQSSLAFPEWRGGHVAKNAALRKEYEQLVADGVKGLTYVPGEKLFGNDGEATVDGTHATDLGFMRMAKALAPVLRGIFGQ